MQNNDDGNNHIQMEEIAKSTQHGSNWWDGPSAVKHGFNYDFCSLFNHFIISELEKQKNNDNCGNIHTQMEEMAKSTQHGSNFWGGPSAIKHQFNHDFCSLFTHFIISELE